ncbi:MAG: LysR family transcriptional regulator [Clostridia bacterium]|nr:LysR family transcriptional regulator [Clostridia bacterium]
MELLQLRYFFESAKNENFAKTAEKYWVPPSSVSAAIKRLEEELGCKLFDRTANRITLNENGKRMQRTLLAVFEELDNTVEDLKHVQTQPLDTEIKILVLSLRESTISAMIEYQKLHRNVRFNATFNVKDANPDDYDIVIDKEISKYPDYERRELCSFRLCFRAPANHPLVGRELTMKDLRHQSFVTMETEGELNSALFESCKKAGFFPNIVVQTNDPDHYKYSTKHGLGLSLWRQYKTPQPDQLVNLSVSDFQVRQTMYLYYRRNALNEQIQNFIDYLTARHAQ